MIPSMLLAIAWLFPTVIEFNGATVAENIRRNRVTDKPYVPVRMREVDGTAGFKLALPVASGELMAVAPAADVLAAVDALGLDANGIVDWDAIGAQVTANFEATGHWFI